MPLITTSYTPVIFEEYNPPIIRIGEEKNFTAKKAKIRQKSDKHKLNNKNMEDTLQGFNNLLMRSIINAEFKNETSASASDSSSDTSTNSSGNENHISKPKTQNNNDKMINIPTNLK